MIAIANDNVATMADKRQDNLNAAVRWAYAQLATPHGFPEETEVCAYLTKILGQEVICTDHGLFRFASVGVHGVSVAGLGG